MATPGFIDPKRRVFTVEDLVAKWEEALNKVIVDHEQRLRNLERRDRLVTAGISAVVSLVAAVATAYFQSGCT